MRRAIVTTFSFVLIPLLVSAGPTAQAAAPWPVPGPIRTEFDPPDPDWLPGHRGLDLDAPPGTAVTTPAAGVVVFAGRVGGVPVVVVQHGITRATYQPVTPDLTVGTTVSGGQRIGVLAEGGHCSAVCLHWGLKLGDAYLDPRLLLGTPRVVLRPVE